MTTAKDMGLYPFDLLGLIFVAAGVIMIVGSIVKIVNGPATRKTIGPASYKDYMEAQKEAENKNEDPNASRPSTKDRH